MKKKHGWIKLVAILAAVVGGLVAVATFLKKKGKKIREELEFDDELYFDDDDDFEDDILNGDETVEPEDADDDMIPDESADNAAAEGVPQSEPAEGETDAPAEEEPKE